MRAVNYLFRLFVIAYNLMATFHIYSVVPDFTDPSSPQYCDETTYTLAYVLVILFDVFFALVIFIWISALVMGLLFPEMVENLYEKDYCESEKSSLPDIGNSQSGLGACGAGPTCEACRRLERCARNGSLRSLEKCYFFVNVACFARKRI